MSLRIAANKIVRRATTTTTKQNGVVRRVTVSTMASTGASSSTTSTSQRTAAAFVAGVTASLLLSSSRSNQKNNNKTYNHCQVPCGIFDDPAMVAEVKQNAATIRKAMVQSHALWKDHHKDIQSMNQVVRWIITKEEHCDKIITLMGDYCLCQRVKRASFATESDYLHALQLHHKAMQAAMKAKQSMDVATCDALDHALEDLGKMYT